MTDYSQNSSVPEPKKIIQLSDLTFTYKKADAPTLDIPSWSVEKNSTVFLYGPSGSGKSTLLNILGGLLVPQKGEVTILDTCINKMRGSKRDKFRAQHIGMIFQQFNLIPWLSVKENILAAQYFSGKSQNNQNIIETIYKLLEALNLSQTLIDKKTEELSIGQQQRVAIARALINQPEIIIADEPTSSLDTDARDNFMSLLFNVTESIGSTLIFVSHDKGLSSFFNKTVDLTSINKAAKLAKNLETAEANNAA